MRVIMLATAAAVLMSVPMAAAVKAEDSTTIIKKDVDGDRTKTVIKKEEPHDVDKKVIIKKDND
jgi:hypothetical protein